jgi:hypothetical protein
MPWSSSKMPRSGLLAIEEIFLDALEILLDG